MRLPLEAKCYTCLRFSAERAQSINITMPKREQTSRKLRALSAAFLALSLSVLVLQGCTRMPSFNSSPPPRAKELFVQYVGNPYYMGLDGVRDEYEQFKVPKSFEMEWEREDIANLVSRLPQYDETVWFKLARWRAREALPEILKWPPPGDSLAKWWYAVDLWDLANPIDSQDSPHVPKEVLDQAQAMVISVFRELATGPITFDPNRDPKDFLTGKREDGTAYSSPEEALMESSQWWLAKALKGER